MAEKKKTGMGLVTKLIIAIALGILVGQLDFIPEVVLRIFVTFSSIFSSFLSFIIPLMIIGFVVQGIADLTEGAGALLGITVLVSYLSTLLAGSISYFTSVTLFPSFITQDLVDQITAAGDGLSPIFSIPLEPMIDVSSAIVFAFVMGLGISVLKGRGKGEVLYEFFADFGEIIVAVLNSIIIPFLPLYIFGNFANLSYSGSVFAIMSVFWRVFLIVIVLHILYIAFMFVVFGTYGGVNPLRAMKNQIAPYMTAIGTQSSAATIPVNVAAAERNGVSEQIRNFVVPLCATIHLAGSMITITACSVSVILMFNLEVTFPQMIGFIAMLGVAMVAAPGAPGGAIMAALPFMPMVNISTEVMQQLMISLYITQDSFGTAANVSGDNAIAIFVDKVYHKYIKKNNDTPVVQEAQEV